MKSRFPESIFSRKFFGKNHSIFSKVNFPVSPGKCPYTQCLLFGLVIDDATVAQLGSSGGSYRRRRVRRLRRRQRRRRSLLLRLSVVVAARPEAAGVDVGRQQVVAAVLTHAGAGVASRSP